MKQTESRRTPPKKQQRHLPRRYRALWAMTLVGLLLFNICSNILQAKAETNAAPVTIHMPSALPAEASEPAEPDMEALQETLETALDELSGTWSVYVKDLNTDESFVIGSQKMYAASLIKLYVMESVYKNWDLLLANEQAASGADEETAAETLHTLLNNMITLSDNESYNELVRLHSSAGSFSEGCAYIEGELAEFGYEDTGIYHTLSPSDTEPEKTVEDMENTTSVADCGQLLSAIYNGTCVSEKASEEMLDLLRSQQIETKIPAALPDEAEVANKTGETETEQHDAAIVFGPECDYVLCIMSSDLSSAEEGASGIQKLSALVYEALNESNETAQSE